MRRALRRVGTAVRTGTTWFADAMSTFILGVVYFTIALPFGIAIRFMVDPLRRRSRPTPTVAWRPRRTGPRSAAASGPTGNGAFVLGISCHYHDAAAVLLRDGEPIAAAEEERFSRKKHDSGFPRHAIEFCLRSAGIQGQDLDLAVFYEDPFLKFERVLVSSLGETPFASTVFTEAMRAWLREKLWVQTAIATDLGLPPARVVPLDHHVSHAASAFFCSPFENAAILTADGVGEWTSTGLGTASGAWPTGSNRLELTHEARFPDSLGLLYSAFTAYLGFEVNEGEYKVMGMAPYGTPRYVDEIRKVIRVGRDGSFELDLRYFEYTRSTRRMFSDEFVRLFGPPRVPEVEFVTRSLGGPDDSTTKENERFADIAASLQVVIEDVLLASARGLRERTGLEDLCFAGGVALNAVANGRLSRAAGFRRLWVQPAAGDSGGALGAALYAYHVLLGKPRRWTMTHAFLGADYGADEIFSAIEGAGLRAERLDPASLPDRVTELLVGGKVVGWFHGRFEWGPRALGHRSILADPRRAEMKGIVNETIKFREPFRPFAPVVTRDAADRFFDLAPAEDELTRFMLSVVPIRSGARDMLGAVDHMGTARVQVIDPAVDPLLHRLTTTFGEATGVPVLLNTSFNLRGEPMVASPRDAVRTFMASGLDALVMGDHLAQKP